MSTSLPRASSSHETNLAVAGDTANAATGADLKRSGPDDAVGQRRQRSAPPPPPAHGVLPAIASMLEITAIALFLVAFLIQPFRIPSESMVPTLRVGDFLLVDKQSYSPQGTLDKLLLPRTDIRRGDLVVFHFPVDLTLHLVKRVVGIPGDRVHLAGGRVYLNGRRLEEPYAFYSPSLPNDFRDNFPSLRETDPNADPVWWAELRRIGSGGEVTVPPDHYFVMGDNRNDSEDSRYWGFVPRQYLVGRPLVVYFSLSNDGLTEPDGVLDRILERWGGIFRSMRVLR